MYDVFIHGVLSYVLSNGNLNWLICFSCIVCVFWRESWGKAAGTGIWMTSFFLFIASCLLLKRASSPEVSKRSVSFKETAATV